MASALDSDQTASALLNLIVNARDAMPGGGTLTIRSRNLPGDAAGAEGDWVELEVSDTGAGMSPETIERAFEPFYTTKGVGEGTGLGLSQVYGFVTQSNGAIKILSEVGAGTTINIRLPRGA